jgi:restriction system protein
MDIDSTLQMLVKNIQGERQYWLVRTMGGDFYKQYVQGNYIAIGYNEVTKADIDSVIKLGDKAREVLKEKIKIIDTEEEINESYAASRLLTFQKDIKIGDVVIIPAKGSYNLQIGYVDSEVYEDNETIHFSGNCPFSKRREVNWVKQVSRDSLNPKLQLMFNSRHIISDINDYSEYIDTLLNDFYIKDNQAFLVLKVNHEESIAANDITLIGDLLKIVDNFSEENSLTVSSDDINIKISVQSPGDILFYATKPEVIILLGLIVILINGGTFKVEKWGFEIGTQGLITKISEFIDRRVDRKTQEAVIRKLQDLEIDDPKDLIEIIKETKNQREKY